MSRSDVGGMINWFGVGVAWTQATFGIGVLWITAAAFIVGTTLMLTDKKPTP